MTDSSGTPEPIGRPFSMVRSDTVVFQKANPNEFDRIRAFYWALIDAMAADNDKIG